MEINVLKFKEICRTCLSEEDLIPIVNSTLNNGILVAEVLTNFIPSEDLDNDELPQQICLVCVENLSLYYGFKSACDDNQNLLKSYLDKCDIEVEHKVDINSYDDNGSNVYLSSDDELPLVKRVDRPIKRRRRRRQTPKSSLKNIKQECLEDNNCEETIDTNTTYSCKHCNKSFPHKYRLAIHSRVHTKERPFKCDECDLTFSLTGNLRRHKMIHTGERPHICTICGKGFIQAPSLQIHIRKRHNPAAQCNNLTCKICGRIFMRIRAYALHMKKRHPEDIKQEQVVKEQPEEHEELKIEIQSKGDYKCGICGNEFAKLVFLKRHQTRHGEKKFLCSECGKGFVRKADLQSHAKVHTGEKPHTCPVCNKSFAHLASLVTHSLLHTGYKSHTCYICSKSFTQVSHLKTHQLTHSGERPHSCSYCGKAFALKSNLTVHIRTHTGETPFVCICGKGFYDSSNMKKHRNSHLTLMDNSMNGEPLSA